MNTLFNHASSPCRGGGLVARIVSHTAIIWLTAVVIVLCAAARPALAAEAPAAASSTSPTITPVAPVSPFGPAFVQVTESTLDGMRGGFTTDTGIQVSFGIERTVMVGGSVVSTTAFHMATGAANGPTLVSSAGVLSGASLLTAVQNSADGQKIQTLTTVNVTANSLQVLKQGNLQALVGGGIAAALRR